MSGLTRYQQLRKQALGLYFQKADPTNPTLIDYHLDDWLRTIHDLPDRPENQEPYAGWIVGNKQSNPAQMQTSQVGLELIKRWEGYRTNAYLCPANVWTIGYGHTKGVKRGDKISRKQAEQLLIKDLEYYKRGVRDAVKVPLNQNQFDALVSFCYNVGVNAFKGSTLVTLLNRKQYILAAEQFLRWTRGGGRVLPGLVSRRKDEYELFLS